MKAFCILVLSMITLNVFAQEAAPEAKQPPRERDKWSHSSALGFTLTSGNSETLTFSLAHNSERKDDKSKLTFGLSAAYGVQEVDNAGQKRNDEFVKNFSFNTQYNRTIYKRLFWYVGQNTEIDRIASLEYRLNVGPGLGYKVIEEEKMTFDVELGVNYIREKYENIDADDKAAGRLGAKFDWNISDSSKLWVKSELLVNLEDADDFRTNSELGVEVKVSKYLNIRSALQHKFTNEPPAGIEENDFIFITSVVFKY